jgi:hypothetical protein
MAEAVARQLKNAAREVKVGDCIFDVVAYDKGQRLFRLVECKLGSKAASIGHAFGQVAAYYAVVVDQGYHFVDTFSKKVEPRLRFGRLLEATEGKQIRVEFYVALTDEACERVDLLRSVKRLLPDVGIIRVKADGRCRDHVHEHGKGDYELAQARPMLIKILQPTKPANGTE